MAVRIRVYPQYGGLGMNGLNQGGAVSAATYYNSKLQTQKQVSTLQLGYERALANERIEKVRLEERLKNPYAALNTGYAGAYGGVGLPIGGLGAGLPIGALGMGMPIGTQNVGIPQGFPGSGQSNSTNQVSTGAATQTVTNSNVSNVSHAVTSPPWAGGYGGYGFQQPAGGFLSGLLGALI